VVNSGTYAHFEDLSGISGRKNKLTLVFFANKGSAEDAAADTLSTPADSDVDVEALQEYEDSRNADVKSILSFGNAWKTANALMNYYLGESYWMYLYPSSDSAVSGSTSSGSSGSSGGGGGGGGSAAFSGSGYKSSSSGSWCADQTGWWFKNSDGSYPRDQWSLIKSVWYHFNTEGYAETGWILLNGQKYYLDPETCAMKTGWIMVGTDWYYLNTLPGSGGMLPYGALLVSAVTPDGYTVNQDGIWVR
jgi:glucan-binding YG repeat protein